MNGLLLLSIIGAMLAMSVKWTFQSERVAKHFLFTRDRLLDDQSSYIICHHCGTKVKRGKNHHQQCSHCYTSL
ncbi:hypothetical protein [Metabacillus iocasae]|uniref:Paraquat-inducible protein A n=1 Tax=Priestia iocasae TaxID=2291674 RepID=A0ABS2R2U7_9BACI|nr:hypothetical protein [Metabacillus iocasae]MBM7705049.1 putative paraquat-inducible protein A [Metabacillus iocasae]